MPPAKGKGRKKKEKEKKKEEKQKRGKRRRTKETKPGFKLNFKAVKTALKKLTTKEILEKLKALVGRFHEIQLLASQLFNLYFRYVFEEKIPFPAKLNKNFVVKFLYTVCISKNKVDIPKDINFVFQENRSLFPPILPKKDFIHPNIFMEVAEQMAVNFKNNIYMHFWNRVHKTLQIMEGKEKGEEIWTKFSEISFKHPYKPTAREAEEEEEEEKEEEEQGANLEERFFITALMQKDLEESGHSKLFSAVPLTRSFIWNSITIDTISLWTYFQNKFPKIGIRQAIDHRDEIWNAIFPKLRRRSGKDHTFHYRICTNGISLSIMYSKEVPKSKKEDKKRKKKKKKPNVNKEEKKKKLQEELEKLPNGLVVGVDPGKVGIVHFATKKDGKTLQMRYTTSQRFISLFYFFFLKIK